jgi:hypothetical protein
MTKYSVRVVTGNLQFMRSLEFDPFGEPLYSARLQDAVHTPASKLVSRLGAGFFWALVVTIIAARALYFDPDATKTLGVVAIDAIHGLIKF